MAEGDNGKIEQPKKEEPKPVVMTIEMLTTGQIKVSFSFLSDKIATYGFLKMAEKAVDEHYAQLGQPKITPARGGIMNFIRGKN